jgi:hypothetical protein
MSEPALYNIQNLLIHEETQAQLSSVHELHTKSKLFNHVMLLNQQQEDFLCSSICYFDYITT